MQASFIMESNKDQEFLLWKVVGFMKANGIRIVSMVKQLKYIQMAVSIKGNFIKVKDMEKDFTNGLMLKNMMENGIKD